MPVNVVIQLNEVSVGRGDAVQESEVRLERIIAEGEVQGVALRIHPFLKIGPLPGETFGTGAWVRGDDKSTYAPVHASQCVGSSP